MIPRVLHQIWLGPRMPDDLRRLRDQHRRALPDWSFELWTLERLEPWVADRDLWRWVLGCGKPVAYGALSDLTRVEIVFRSSGVYMDLDYELSPDAFHGLDSYCGGFGIRLTQGHEVFCNSLFGGPPGMPALAECMQLARERVYRYGSASVVRSIGNFLLDRCFKARSIPMLPLGVFCPAGHRRANAPEPRGVHLYTSKWIADRAESDSGSATRVLPPAGGRVDPKPGSAASGDAGASLCGDVS